MSNKSARKKATGPNTNPKPMHKFNLKTSSGARTKSKDLPNMFSVKSYKESWPSKPLNAPKEAQMIEALDNRASRMSACTSPTMRNSERLP